MSVFFEVNNVSKSFGGLTAVDNVSFRLDEGQILGLVGPNGSGKSTMLNILSGVYAADGGSVIHRGRKLSGLSPSVIASAGLARTFQNLQIFQGLTVGENVLVGRNCRMRSTVIGSVFGSPFARREETEARERARQLLGLVGLERFIDGMPSSLSYGQRRLLEIARALASEPSVLMLDEPCAGLAQSEADELAAFIRTLGASGIGVIVIEHNMRFVMGLVDRIVALNFGRKIAEGDPRSIRENEAVIAAYLGRKRHVEH
ncbi:MAG: ABC-type branched-chain amino acid transport system, ATPase component [Microvirga sp.]|jgi:branched-chain amino acid transport system ATP-binding protein|nr:ABC-type branched-chain amino acid transport system, ATPase component [Microvirga sp.]